MWLAERSTKPAKNNQSRYVFWIILMSVRALQKVLRLLMLLSMSQLWAQGAAAETMYPLITYKCNPGSDIITITNQLLTNDEGKTYHYSDDDGTYSPWSLVEIDRSLPSAKIVNTTKITKLCELSSGTYTVVIEPHLFGNDLSGRCGEALSAAVTITYDGIDILERTPFEDFCKGNAPVIIRVTTFGKTGDVKIKRIPKYKFY